MTAAVSLFGAFVVGLGARSRLREHFALLFRIQFAGGLGALAVLAGWSFDVSLRNVGAVGVLLVTQLSAVLFANWVFRKREDGALVAFSMYGNPTYWALPIATAVLGAHAAVFLVAYDMLTQPRIALAVKLMRSSAPTPQLPGTAMTDYAPSVCAIAGLLFGLVVKAPESLDSVVAVLGIGCALSGTLLLGVAWPRTRPDRFDARRAAAALAVHFTFVPALLLAIAAAGIDLPGAVWFVALGPLPTSTVAFARLYGFSVRTAAVSMAMSAAIAAALLPLTLSWPRRRGRGGRCSPSPRGPRRTAAGSPARPPWGRCRTSARRRTAGGRPSRR